MLSDETHPRGISQGYRAEYHSLALILIDDNDDEAGEDRWVAEMKMIEKQT
jgi:hypothetical protein